MNLYHYDNLSINYKHRLKLIEFGMQLAMLDYHTGRAQIKSFLNLRDFHTWCTVVNREFLEYKNLGPSVVEGYAFIMKECAKND